MKSLVKVLLCLAAFSPLSMNAQWGGSGDCCFDSCCEQYYASVWGGGNSPFHNKTHHDRHLDLDTGWYVGGAIGMHWNGCYFSRVDLSFDYLRNDIDRNSGDDSSSSSSNNDFSKYVVLANAYYDFCPWGCVTPYVGAGVGYAYIRANDHHQEHHIDRNAFAWQVGAGLTYEINSCWSAGFQYRLLGTTNDSTSYHNLYGVSLTRQF